LNNLTESHPTSPPESTRALRGRRVLANAGALASSSLWRIGISFALQLFIARALGLRALGQYTVALAYLNVCQVIGELGLQTLLVRDLAQAPTQRQAYFRLTLLVRLAVSGLIWGALWGLSLLPAFGETTGIALRLVGATLPFYAVTSTCQMLFQAGERMELVMGVEVFTNTLIVGLSLAILWRGGDVVALVGVLIATQAVSALVCLLLLRRRGLFIAPQRVVSLPWRSLWRRAAPFYSLALADVLLQRLDILLLSVFAGPALTGVYSAAYNVVRVLIKLVQSVWQALYPTLSRLQHHAPVRYRRLALLAVRYGLLLVLGGAAVSAGVADGLLHAVYGAESTPAVPVFRTLIWIAPVFLLETYAILLLLIERKPLHSLLLTALHLGTVVFSLPFLTVGIEHGAQGAAIAVLLANGVGALGGVLLLRRYHLPLDLTRAPIVLITALCVAWSSAWLPFFWMTRATLGLLLYGTALLVAGVLRRDDLHRVRSLLSARNAPP